jgi:hypothetical protein
MTAKPSNIGLPKAGPQVVFVKRAAATIACAAVALAAPVAAPAADRLDRVAEGLERKPLYVHPDLLWLVPERARGQVTRALRGASEPLHLAVMPLLEEDESGGDGQRVLDGLRHRLGRPGRYLLMDQLGSIDIRAADGQPLQVPVELRFPDEGKPPRPVRRLLAAIRLAPSASPPYFGASSDLEETPALPGQPESQWRDVPLAAGFGLGGGVAAFIVLVLAAAGLRRLRGGGA